MMHDYEASIPQSTLQSENVGCHRAPSPHESEHRLQVSDQDLFPLFIVAYPLPT